jgi:ParB-like chromosome segregation protein Spo0J
MAKSKIRVENLVAALQRLSRRERYMVGGVAIMFVIFISVLVGMWISSSLNSLNRRIEDKTKNLQLLIDERQKYEDAKRVTRDAERIMKRGRNIQLMSAIEETATRQGVNVEDMSPRAPTVNNEANVSEEKVEVNIKMITIDRLVDFLKEIERKSKTIAVRKLHIKQNFQQPDQLEVGFTVSNYRLIKDTPDEPAAPAAPAGPAASKAAIRKPTTGRTAAEKVE